jgi:hypothetical protein
MSNKLSKKQIIELISNDELVDVKDLLNKTIYKGFENNLLNLNNELVQLRHSLEENRTDSLSQLNAIIHQQEELVKSFHKLTKEDDIAFYRKKILFSKVIHKFFNYIENHLLLSNDASVELTGLGILERKLENRFGSLTLKFKASQIFKKKLKLHNQPKIDYIVEQIKQKARVDKMLKNRSINKK